MTTANDLTLLEVTAADTFELRRRVLRSHLPDAPVTTADDDDPATVHVAAQVDGRVVGVVTMFSQEAPGRPGEAAMRFRWMAVDPALQGGGVGRALMREVDRRARAAGAALLWANGRDTALDFYRRLGFSVVGDAFDDEVSLLPHHLILREL